jgi:hypothetical protein
MAILVTGGTGPGDAGQTIVGTASNKNHTDSYTVVGYNNHIIENGGNLDVNLAAFQDTTEPQSPNTEVDLGNGTGVTDTIDLSYGIENVLQLPGTSLTRANVNVVLWGGSPTSTVTLINDGGSNDVNLLESTLDTVTLTGAVNIVQGGWNSTIRLNGDATNTVTPFEANVIIGSADDGFFGHTTTIQLGGPNAHPGMDEGINSVIAGDENVTITGPAEQGYDRIALGNGNDNVNIAGTFNTVTVGGGNNVINAGTDVATVNIVGDTDSADQGRVPKHPTDIVTLGSSENVVTATYENVTILGTYTSGSNTVSLGDGNNTISLGVPGSHLGYNFVTVGDGKNTITLNGDNDRVTVNDTTGSAREQISLGIGVGDTVSLGMAGGTITNTGTGTTTISQSMSATAAVIVNLTGEGIVTLGDGRDVVTAGANSTVTVGNGNDTLSVSQGSTLLAGAGHDTFTLGDQVRLGVTGSSTSKAVVQLGNDDFVGVTGGRVVTNDTVGNDTVLLDDVSRGSRINFTNPDDLVGFGMNSSARVFLNPGGGDAITIQASDATGSYAGTIDLTGFTNDILYLGDLVGGKVAEALNSAAAVFDNTTRSGSEQILSLGGGGEVVFHGNVTLAASELAFTTLFGPVVPSAL